MRNKYDDYTIISLRAKLRACPLIHCSSVKVLLVGMRKMLVHRDKIKNVLRIAVFF